MRQAAQESPPQGLSSAEAARQRAVFGPNDLEPPAKHPVLLSLRNIATEPMFILLAVACALYFALGDRTEGMMMVLSILFVAGIELYQETKSERALEALRRYTRATVRALRDGRWTDLPSEELVPGDIVQLNEGERAPADGVLREQNDLSMDESVLTGESLPVEKSLQEPDNQVFQGSVVAAGTGIFQVTATGVRTEFGKLGKSIESIDSSPTPLQLQIKRFVRSMGIAGGLAFVLVFALNFAVENDVWKALLFSLTMAMAILPEEIPVAFSAFMGLGAYRMIGFGILAKQPKTVESLGSATVICLDKTGTITENRMSVAEILDFSGQNRVLERALWASEPRPFDAMEKALLRHWQSEHPGQGEDPRTSRHLTKEYALGGKPPMMTHVWADENAPQKHLVASKGAVERLLEVSRADAGLRTAVMAQTEALAAKGYRVLAVGSAEWAGGDFPAEQSDFPWALEGLVAFYDPPKANASAVFEQMHQAGIRVLMITGDHAATAQNIARSTGLRDSERVLTGQAVMAMPETELRQAVREVNVFARMFPDAKLRVVEALKANGETVAMSGDGVNDGPALKAAQIGVAMGKKGTEIAKSAASLVLLQDDLGAMLTAVAMGRRIYDNLRKSIRYIISIHLPIVLVVLLPLLLGWPYPHILLPLHVIFLELVMDPIAAIAYENEPADPNLMQRPPRSGRVALFSWKELTISVLQGGAIALGVLLMYQYTVASGGTEAQVRAVVFATMVSANLFLVLANRSFEEPLHRTIRYKNAFMPIILGISMLMLLAILYVPFLADLFRVASLPALELGRCALAGFASAAWFELYKFLKN
jgi:Ca2+-transporting ATPase